MIELYGMGSPNVLKVMIMLEEAGLPYRLHRIDVWTGEQHADAFRRLNPNGKVPVIVDPDGPDGAPCTVFESGAILLYLAEKTGTLWPATLRERVAVNQWLMFQMASVGPMFGQAIHFSAATTEPVPYGRSRFVTEYHRLMDVIEARLGAVPYLAGQDYSLADIALYPWIRNMERYRLSEGVPPHLARWVSTIAARPAVQRADSNASPLRKADKAGILAADDDARDRFFGRGKYARD